MFGVCVCVLFIYTISINISCVSLKELSFLVSIQQISDFYKGEIFGKQRHCETLWTLWNFLCQHNVHSCCEHIAGVVNIYLCCCVSLLAPMHAVCLCVCGIKSEY